MRKHHFKCDKCGVETVSLNKGEMTDLVVGRDIERHDGSEVALTFCDPCVVLLAEFAPYADRSIQTGLGRYVSHDMIVGMSSATNNVRCPRHSSIQVTEMPSRIAATSFTPTRFEIDDPTSWSINDITIGHRTQFVDAIGSRDRSPIPGAMFSDERINALIKYEQCQFRMEIAVVATYVGANPEGACFAGRFHGRAMGFPPKA